MEWSAGPLGLFYGGTEGTGALMLKRRFQVLLEGRPIRLRLEGRDQAALFGWYATRLIWASDEEDARKAAIASVTEELKELGAEIEPGTPDTLRTPEIVQLVEVSRFRLRGTSGFTFYPGQTDATPASQRR